MYTCTYIREALRHHIHNRSEIECTYCLANDSPTAWFTSLRDTHRERPEIPESAPFLSRHEAPIWGIQGFPTIKITDSSGVYVRRSWVHLFAIVSMCVVGKNSNTSKWSSMADSAITRGGIGVLGSPFYICGDTMVTKRECAQRYRF